MKMRVNIVDLFDSTVETKGSQIATESALFFNS